MPAGKNYKPSSGANDGYLIVTRTSGAIVTMNREKLDTGGHPKGSVVSRRIVRNEPTDKVATLTKGAGVIPSGTSVAE